MRQDTLWMFPVKSCTHNEKICSLQFFSNLKVRKLILFQKLRKCRSCWIFSTLKYFPKSLSKIRLNMTTKLSTAGISYKIVKIPYKHPMLQRACYVTITAIFLFTNRLGTRWTVPWAKIRKAALISPQEIKEFVGDAFRADSWIDRAPTQHRTEKTH